MSEDGAAADSRLALAVELLRSVIDAGEGPGIGPGHRAHASLLVAPDVERRLSATDLISFWFQPAASALDPWDEFFSTGSPGGRGGAGADASGDGPWTELRALVPDAGGELADEQAEAAVQCLYEFVHALGRGDVDAAMELVADDYHTLEDDREFDQLGLRQQLEALLGSLEGWEIDASLVTIPEAIPYPTGVAVMAELQFDGFRPEDDAWRSVVQRRVAVLEPGPERTWLISALSPV